MKGYGSGSLSVGFLESFYLELSIMECRTVEGVYYDQLSKSNVPLIITNDVHILRLRIIELMMFIVYTNW